MKLGVEPAYMPVIKAVKALDNNIVLNVCRWQFPGEWVIDQADSWRVSTDIGAKFTSVLKIIDLNANLSKYASAGHYNDMDMSIEILTNKEVIALNQDPAFKQAERVLIEGQIEVWLKPLSANNSKAKAIAIMNKGDQQITFELKTDDLHIDPKRTIRDLWEHKDVGKLDRTRNFTIPKHGIILMYTN